MGAGTQQEVVVGRHLRQQATLHLRHENPNSDQLRNLYLVRKVFTMHFRAAWPLLAVGHATTKATLLSFGCCGCRLLRRGGRAPVFTASQSGGFGRSVIDVTDLLSAAS